ncbi:MAG: MFS transporter [Pseudonocardiaceae bacterium]|nr:MFS transporter [Pseudonocardiaceae bacterium]
MGDSPAVDRRATRRALYAAGVGNLLEWYDFAVFAFLTPVIADLFFPNADPIAALLATFAVFAVGFGMRPVGAVVFGRLADKVGRRWTLLVVITMMGVATVLIGFMPTYATAGLVAPILLVVARLLQGLSVGGEFGVSASFLVEYAPSRRRGLYGSVAYLTADLGNFFGGAVVFALTGIVSAATLSQWGWRLPFLLSFPLLLVGLYMRLRIEETPRFRALAAAQQKVQSPVSEAIRRHWRQMLMLIGVGIAFAVSSYTVLAFMVSYLTSVLDYSLNTTLLAVITATLIGAVAVPFCGALSDRVGRKPVLLAASITTIVLAYPGYLILGLGTFVMAIVGQLVLWVPVSLFCGVAPAAYSEMFPTNVRVSGFGVAYAIAVALFSGTTPFVATLLIDVTGNVLSPAWYLIASGVVSLLVIMRIPETATKELSDSRPADEPEATVTARV